jgi:trans-aconitate methyltransferase
MWYSIGEVILLKPNCRLASGKLLKDSLPNLVGKSAIIVLQQIGWSNTYNHAYCHYKLKLTDESLLPLNKYFKVFHDDGVCIDISYKRNETLKNIIE